MIDSANVVLPLAASYNTRGAGLASTDVFTNGADQRKINSYYEQVTNAITGTSTLYLTKRPGVSKDGNTYGTTGQAVYLIIKPPSTASGIPPLPWVIATASGNIRACNSAGAISTIVAAGSLVPRFWDKMPISGTENIFVQLWTDESTAQRVFYASVIGSWTEITDGDFTGLVHRGKMEAMDGYLFTLDSMNRIYNSDLNSIANWTPTNFITKQVQQDYPRGLAKLNNQIIAFGGETMEVFNNTGNSTGSPLSSNRALFQRVGIPYFLQSSTAPYYAIVGPRMYFLGNVSADALSNAPAGLYVYDGSSVQKVSTSIIDKIMFGGGIESLTRITVLGQDAIAISVQSEDPGFSPQYWLMYFPKWNEWFEWTNTVFGPVNDGYYFLGVGSNSHRVYYFPVADNWRDDGVDYTMTHQFKIPKSDNARSYMGMCGVKGNTARSASSLAVSFSDDDWQTTYSAGTIDMTQQKKHIYQCGSYTDRGVILTHTGNVELRLESFLARIS